MKSTLQHHRFGEITVSQTRRARRISLSIRPPGRIRLSLPCNVPLSEALRFVEQRSPWIEKHLGSMAAGREENITNVPFSTRRHTLVLSREGSCRITIRVTRTEIAVGYPSRLEISDDRVQGAIRKGIEQAWLAEAREYLPSRVEELAREHGLRTGKVAIRNTVSKWGSCSVRNDLSLSLHLMRLPDHLIDYILLHELCHVVHKNHGPDFHRMLERMTGGRHKELNRELKRYHTGW